MFSFSFFLLEIPFEKGSSNEVLFIILTPKFDGSRVPFVLSSIKIILVGEEEAVVLAVCIYVNVLWFSF